MRKRVNESLNIFVSKFQTLSRIGLNNSIIISIPNRLIDHLMTFCSLLINLVIIRLTPQATINGMKVKRNRKRERNEEGREMMEREK